MDNKIQRDRCSSSWQPAHRVIKFKSSSEPCWLRSCLWWTCRFCLEPQTWHLPAIAAQYLFSELVVELGIKPQARSLGSNPVHEAFSVTSCRKACRCSPGRNLKNRDIDCRSTVGSSFSRFAPARKSAQIISRQ